MKRGRPSVQYIKTYHGHIDDLFHSLSYETEWEFARDTSWTLELYTDCVIKIPLHETYGKKKVKEGFKFDFIVFVRQDDGSDLDHFSGFSTKWCKSKETIQFIHKITSFYKSDPDYSNSDEENMIDLIESYLDCDDAFLFNIDNENTDDDSTY